MSDSAGQTYIASDAVSEIACNVGKKYGLVFGIIC